MLFEAWSACPVGGYTAHSRIKLKPFKSNVGWGRGRVWLSLIAEKSHARTYGLHEALIVVSQGSQKPFV